MVSRRNYFVISILMAVIFFLFQFTNATRDAWNEYGTNAHATGDDALLLAGTANHLPIGGTGTSDDASGEALPEEALRALEEEGYVAYIGGGENAGMRMTVDSWAMYTKRTLLHYASLGELQEGQEAMGIGSPAILLLDSEFLDWQADLQELLDYAQEGTHLYFLNLPEVSVIKQYKKLRTLLGIQSVRQEQVTVDGIHLFQGFLLGGETIYELSEKDREDEEEVKRQDMELEMPWYKLAAGTKVYMKGILEDEDIDSEEYPPIIWRNSLGAAKVFAVIGSYMEDISGIGILDGMVAETVSYALYPVVNAQNLVLVNDPAMADENGEAMQRLYSQSMSAVFKNVFWPGLTSTVERTTMGTTYMLAPQFDYGDVEEPDADDLVYYMKLINEQDAEVGLTVSNVSGTEPGEKLAEDISFIQVTVPDYRLGTLYIGDLEDGEVAGLLEAEELGDIYSVYAPYLKGEPLLEYLTDTVMRQSAVVDGFVHTYRDNFRVKCIESALGYTSISADIMQAAYPEEDTESWEKLMKKFSSYTNTYWNAFDGFEGTTLSESDTRIRRFLALDYTEERERNEIRLKLDGAGGMPAWFLLRLHNETVVGVEGGTYTLIEEGAYLIEAQEEEISISLKSGDERYYYMGEWIDG